MSDTDRRNVRDNPEPNRPLDSLSVVDFALATGDTSSDVVAAASPIDRRASTTDSFELFYRVSRPTVARALALTLRDTELASNAVDEAMARAYERWGRVRTLDNPAGWVYRVGLNWSRSFVRRARRPTPIWFASSGSHTDAAGTDPTIERALGELNVDQRAVVVCRLLIGYSEAQTAQALGIRPGTVKSRLNRAVGRLQTLLAHLDNPDITRTRESEQDEEP